MRFDRMGLTGLSMLLLLLGLASGCGSQNDTMAPQDLALDTTVENMPTVVESDKHGGQRGRFYPLALGNRWSFVGRVVSETTFDDGSPPEILTIHTDIETELTGTEVLNGNEYVVEQTTLIEDIDPENLIQQWVRYRQDRAGLYEADVAVNNPPSGGSGKVGETREQHIARRVAQSLAPRLGQHAAQNAADQLMAKLDVLRAARRGLQMKSPPGGPRPQELIRLKYPLRRGQEWDLRPGDDFFQSNVSGRRHLQTPAGNLRVIVVEVRNASLSETDIVELYVNRRGFVGLHFEIDIPATNEDGEVVGSLHFVQRELLSDISIRRGRHFAEFSTLE